MHEHDLELIESNLLDGEMTMRCKSCNQTFFYTGVIVIDYKVNMSTSSIVLEHTVTIKGGDKNA